MTIELQLQQSISRWNLLDSAFYQAWSAGELPLEALSAYAREYGAFISTIADGWRAHGDESTAAEECEHVELWRRFASALGTDIAAPEVPEVRSLVELSRKQFADSTESLGALYAFEAQQPGAARSKLEGLRRHYDVDQAGEAYFEVHQNDFEEPALLLQRIKALPASEQARAAEACEEMSRSLRSALDGLYAGCAN